MKPRTYHYGMQARAKPSCISSPGPGKPPGEAARVDARLAVWTAFVLGLAAAMALVLFLARETGLRSDAASVRKPMAVQELIAEAANTPPTPRSGVLSGFTIHEDGNGVTVKVPRVAQAAPATIFDATVHELRPGMTVSFGGGKASLDYVAVGYGLPPPGAFRPDDSVAVPAEYFDGNLKRMPAAAVQKRFHRWERNSNYQGRFPEVRLVIRLQGIPDAKPLGCRMLDARTGEDLCAGYSYGLNGQLAFFETAVQAWHQTPIWAAIDVAYGPVQTQEVIPVKGLEIPHHWGLFRLVGIYQGKETGFTGTSDANSEQTTVRFDPHSPRQETTFVFLGWPGANPVPVDFDFLDKEGTVLSAGVGGGSSGRVKVQSVRASLREIRKMRIKRYPHVCRILLRLPEVPGLPRSNRGVANLFDVKVPYVWFHHSWEMQQFLQHCLQLDWAAPISDTPPPGYFPRAYTNATARQIFQDWAALQPGNLRFRIDPERHRLETAPPFWKQLADQLEKLFHP